ncbi:MAG: hypothetical protein KDN18_06840 [Verrucomicrobiae bacterium]|nr:hypothetical protein [Verrucomicrobiae bacterium]
MSPNHELDQLEALLKERDRLWKLRIIYEGGSERDPAWSGEDEHRFHEIAREAEINDNAIRAAAERLRSLHPSEFRAWLDRRNQLREERLKENPPKWECTHLRETTKRWERFLSGGEDDFFLHIGW